MKISVFYDHIREASRQRGLSIEELLSRARSWGIGALECSNEELRGQEAELGRMLSAKGMGVSSVYAFFEFGERDETALARELIDTALSFGARKVLAVPGFLRGSDPAARKAEGSRMIAGLSRLCDYAAQRGLTVTIEDFDDERSPIATTEGLSSFLAMLPSLGLTFDTGNFMYSGEDELEAFARLAGRVVHVHCKDRALVGAPGEEPKEAADGRPLYASPVGSGRVKMASIVDALLASGYEGYFAIEHFGALDQLSFIERSASWLSAR